MPSWGRVPVGSDLLFVRTNHDGLRLVTKVLRTIVRISDMPAPLPRSAGPNEDRLAVRRYFDVSAPSFPGLWFLFGCGLLVWSAQGNSGSRSDSNLLFVIGAIVVAFIVWNFRRQKTRFRNRPTSNEMAVIFQRDLRRITNETSIQWAPNGLHAASAVLASPVPPERNQRRSAHVDGFSAPYFYRRWLIHILHFADGNIQILPLEYDWYNDARKHSGESSLTLSQVTLVRAVDDGAIPTLELHLASGGSYAPIAAGSGPYLAANEGDLMQLRRDALAAIGRAQHVWATRPSVSYMIPAMAYASSGYPQHAPQTHQPQPSQLGPRHCSNCGSYVQPAQRFCGQCGLQA